MRNTPMTQEERVAAFWSKVLIGNEDECWPWLAYRDKDGYGRFWVGNTFVGAHQFAYLGDYSTSLSNRVLICHSCDNSSCCNPKHLFAGTTQDNIDDKMKKGRHANQYTKNWR